MVYITNTNIALALVTTTLVMGLVLIALGVLRDKQMVSFVGLTLVAGPMLTALGMYTCNASMLDMLIANVDNVRSTLAGY